MIRFAEKLYHDDAVFQFHSALNLLNLRGKVNNEKEFFHGKPRDAMHFRVS
jgi:hypothetical protein